MQNLKTAPQLIKSSSNCKQATWQPVSSGFQRNMTITYTRPIFDQYDNKLLKKRSAPKQISASYSTVRLLDYLDEIQKLKENKDDPPNYMFGKHSLTPWYSHNFIDSMSISISCNSRRFFSFLFFCSILRILGK